MLEFRHAIISQAKRHRVWSRQSIEWSSSGHSAISYGTKHDRSGQNNGIRECFRGWDSNPKVCLHIFYSPKNKEQSKFIDDCYYRSRYTLTPPLPGGSVLAVPRFLSVWPYTIGTAGKERAHYVVRVHVTHSFFFLAFVYGSSLLGNQANEKYSKSTPTFRRSGVLPWHRS